MYGHINIEIMLIQNRWNKLYVSGSVVSAVKLSHLSPVVLSIMSSCGRLKIISFDTEHDHVNATTMIAVIFHCFTDYKYNYDPSGGLRQSTVWMISIHGWN